MQYRLMADLVVVFHASFILFVLFGSILVLRWPWVVFIHLPCIAWGMVVEFFHLYCPLTPLENYFRQLGGIEMYGGDFIDRHLTSIIYPHGLTPDLQVLYGSIVLIVNLVMYGIAIARWRGDRRAKIAVEKNNAKLLPGHPAPGMSNEA